MEKDDVEIEKSSRKIFPVFGALVALITPFKGNGEEVDVERLEKLIEWHFKEGTSGIVVCGTTGESPTLRNEEWKKIVEVAVKTSRRLSEEEKGKIRRFFPVISGCSANSTKTAVEKTKSAAALGVDAVMNVVPFYNKPSQEGLVQHFSAIALAVPALPVVLYNVPSRTGCDMAAETIQRLTKRCPNIVAVKEAGGSLKRIAELLRLLPNDVKIFCGEDEIACEAILLGAHGVITVTGNVCPSLEQQMCQLALKGEKEKARKIDGQLALLHRRLFVESNPIPVKFCVAELLGKCENSVRLPLLPLSSEKHDVLKEALRAATAVTEPSSSSSS